MASAMDGFLAKWSVSGGEERANKDSFLSELCDALGLPRPDPKTGEDARDLYVFEKDVVVSHQGGRRTTRKIDLYRHGSFLLEAKQGSNKGAKKLGSARRDTPAWHQAMSDAHGQALGYASCLDDPPPFLIVCDIGYCFDLYADFDRSRRYNPFPSAQRKRIFFKDLALPEHQQTLRAIFEAPLDLDPSRRAARITREVAAKLAELARQLEAAGHDPTLIARFLMRCLFTMFAEDVGLLPEKAFTEALRKYWLPSPASFPHGIQQLWQKMNEGGEMFGIVGRILRFNGGLFADPSALPLDGASLSLLLDAAECDWSEVEPSIFGTLLERALDPKERHRLGAHYTPRSYVERLVRPTIEEPLRAEWDTVRAQVRSLITDAGKPESRRGARKGANQDETRRKQAVKEVKTFHTYLCGLRVLDPACGTGNFLYVAMDLFRRIENEILTMLDSLGERGGLLALEGVRVTPAQFLGIEIKPWAKEIAEIVLWIGYLQGQIQSLPPRKKGEAPPVPEPVLQDFKNIECRDAILAHDPPELVRDESGKPVSRWDGETYKKDPSTGAQVPDESARIPLYRYPNPRKAEWPKADFIVGNPPFLGNKRMRSALGDGYVDSLREAWGDGYKSIDLVMHWWAKSSELISRSECRRAGLITTNSISQHLNRGVIDQFIKNHSIVFAIPDHPWVDSRNGASVRISMTVLTKEVAQGLLAKVVDEQATKEGDTSVSFDMKSGKINSSLQIGSDVGSAIPLRSNLGLCFMGVTLCGQGFVVDEANSLLIKEPLALKRYLVGNELSKSRKNRYVIDFFGMDEGEAMEKFPISYQRVLSLVKPERNLQKRESYKKFWWIFAEPRQGMRTSLVGIKRYIAMCRTAKHFIFQFLENDIMPESKVIVISSADGFLMGILSSIQHMCWSRKAAGYLGVGNHPTYQHKKTFNPFPFPDPPEALRERIGALGEKLDAFRKERQKEHPELTLTEMYNVLEKLRRGEPLEKKEPEIHQKGLISVLKKIHDDLDAAVFEAYGWPSSLTDEEILERLVALNAERAEEERQGKVRWLRPEYQNPKGEKPASQGEIQDESEDEESEEEAGPKKPTWPAKTREQIVAVRDLLLAQSEAWTALQVARAFKPGSKQAQAEVVEAAQEILESLEALGLLVSYEDEQKQRHWRRAGAPVAERSVARRASMPPRKVVLASAEVEATVAWLESIQGEEQSYEALVELNHRLDRWFREGQADLCRQLLERVQPERLQSGLLVGLLMNSIRGGEPLVEPRKAFRKRIEPVLKDRVGAERTAKILGRIA
jgi:hypothetical protein